LPLLFDGHKYLFTGSATRPQVKLHLWPSNPQLKAATFQIKYCYFLIAQLHIWRVAACNQLGILYNTPVNAYLRLLIVLSLNFQWAMIGNLFLSFYTVMNLLNITECPVMNWLNITESPVMNWLNITECPVMNWLNITECPVMNWLNITECPVFKWIDWILLNVQ
jgi:hypothetical protein